MTIWFIIYVFNFLSGVIAGSLNGLKDNRSNIKNTSYNWLFGFTMSFFTMIGLTISYYCGVYVQVLGHFPGFGFGFYTAWTIYGGVSIIGFLGIVWSRSIPVLLWFAWTHYVIFMMGGYNIILGA